MFFEDSERPLAIQIFGNNEESLCTAAQIAAQNNPDFIDINWGCPVRKIAGKGCGSGILNDIPKMIKLTKYRYIFKVFKNTKGSDIIV